MSLRIVVINGPNLNLLGAREPGIYGALSLDEINSKIRIEASKRDIQVEFRQSNHEGEIINLLQAAPRNFDGVILNPAGYSHTSVAILDAILGMEIPVVEVHLTNIHAREGFRETSITARGSRGMICGFGWYGYIMALEALREKLTQR